MIARAEPASHATGGTRANIATSLPAIDSNLKSSEALPPDHKPGVSRDRDGTPAGNNNIISVIVLPAPVHLRN